MAADGKDAAAFTACQAMLRSKRQKLRVASGKTAVLDAGKSASGDVWKTLQARQRDYVKRLGIEAP